MINSRQHAYLDAMEIDLWCLRDTGLAVNPPAHSPPGLKLGPGRGGVLLICAADTDSSSRLASDISRVMAGIPVWAWPDSEADAVCLPDVVDENLFTTVAIFGRDLAGQYFADELPESLSSANLVLLPSMLEIQNKAESRRILWTTFCRAGMAGLNVRV